MTAGHLSTCPRMLKSADALADAGYEVRVVSARFMDWAWEADRELRRTRSWKWAVVNYDRASAGSRYFLSGIRFRSAQLLSESFRSCPLGVAQRAYSRAHDELVSAVLSEPADLIYGGTTGALGPAAAAAVRAGVPYAVDLEDYYSAESGGGRKGRLFESLANRIELAVLPGAAFITAGSAAIAAAYRQKYGVQTIPLNNTFPLPATEPQIVTSPGAALRLYWFGQTIGPGKGLETVVHALGRAGISGELHLRGRAVPQYVQELRVLAARTAPSVGVVVHEPASPDAMVDLCRPYDVGLASEPGCKGNNEVALSNKGLTYVLAGLAVAISDTPGQHNLAMDLGEGAIVYKPGDTNSLAAGLSLWSSDKSALARAKAAAWAAAKRRWHWEHSEERGALLRAVDAVLQ